MTEFQPYTPARSDYWRSSSNLSGCRGAGSPRTSASRRRIDEIVLGARAVTADTALRLGHYDLDTRADRLGDRRDPEVAVNAS